VSEEVVGLARKDGRLVALVSMAIQEQPESAVRFALRERPADEVRGVLRPPMGRAVEAWTGLRESHWDEPRVLASALTVLLESVPLGDAGAGPRPEAHAGLCAPDAWRRVRKALRANEARVLRLLGRAGHGPQVAMLADARDPYVAYHHRAPSEPGLAALPPRFVAFVLPLLRGRPWQVVRRALALFWGLGLHHDDAALALAVRLLASGREHGLAWLELMAREEPSRRETLGRVLLETGALARDPRGLPARALEDLAAEQDEETHADRLTMVMHGLCAGTDLEYLCEGIRVAREFRPEHRFAGCYGESFATRRPGVPARVTADLWRLLVRFREDFGPDWSSSLPVWLWDWCASTPARAAVLRRPALLEWPALTTFRLLWGLRWRVPGANEIECVAAAERLLSRIPRSHQAKAVDALFTLLRKGRLEPERLTAAIELMVRMARPPFRSRCDSDEAAALLVGAAGARADRLAHVPERGLLKLERALCEDDSDQVQQGLDSLARACGGFLLDALAVHPEPLISAARRLAVLSEPRRLALLKRFRSHPVCQRRFPRQPLERVCRTIEALVRRGLPNPIPRKLREHRAGDRALSAASLERHRQAIVRRLVAFRLALVVRMTLEDLDRGVKADLSCESERHALEMLGSMWRNRRLLRRVLRIPQAEREAFLEKHPANRAWLARHPTVGAETWRAGIVEVAELPDQQRLTLAFERDPMEVLRMGTRVGSCLSVGGCNSASAVAVMADVNKRVIFARDGNGAFVARQLVAIADDDRLVCFPVYPLGIGAAVADAFERYDRALAASLQIAIHRGPEDDYRIAEVLAGGFYDDGAWIPAAPVA
jgi:hypothetical protein